VFASILIAALLTATGSFEGYDQEIIPTGNLYSRGWEPSARARVIRILPKVLSDLEQLLGRRLNRSFTTVLTPDGYELERLVKAWSGSSLPAHTVLGVALPTQSMLFVRGGYSFRADAFETTLIHEVAHLVIHRKKGARIPKWCDEGAATWASGASLSAEEESYLALLARVGSLYRLESLERRFPQAHTPTTIAYQQSYLLVTYLSERYGPESIPRLLDLFEEGAQTSGALQAVAGIPLHQIEQEFRSWVLARRSLLAALSSIVNLWTISALLAIAAIFRLWIRSRRRLAAMREAERTEPETGDGGTEGEDLHRPGDVN
jgi:hypothetical protein